MNPSKREDRQVEKETISKGNGSNGKSAVPFILDQTHLNDYKPAQVRTPVGSQGGVARSDRLESIVTELLTELGVDVNDEHFKGTPGRVARLYQELTRGYNAKPSEILKTFQSKHSELIVVSDIGFNSLCPHHLAVYRGSDELRLCAGRQDCRRFQKFPDLSKPCRPG